MITIMQTPTSLKIEKNDNGIAQTNVLVVFGMQNDKFTSLEDLKLEVVNLKGYDGIIGRVNKCIDYAQSNGWKVVYALDIHHPRHSSFEEQGGVNKRHCVLATWGSTHVCGLHYAIPGSEQVVRGLDIDGDSDDAFYITEKSQCTHSRESRLAEIIREHKTHNSGAANLYLCGISPDGCIEKTAKTGQRLGNKAIIISDCSILLKPLIEYDIEDHASNITMKTMSEIQQL